jgi:replicative DNA helicase
MAKIDKDSLGYLGHDFQLRLISQLIIDEKFSSSIMDIIDPNYFEDEHLRIISATIKDTYSSYEITPDMGSLEARLLDRTSDTIQRKFLISKLQQIKEVSLNDSLWVQDTAMKFCKQQELKKSISIISKIIEKGEISDYDQCEEIIKKALEHGAPKDDGVNVTDNIDEVLSDDYRSPIPTGIKGLDEVMDGGLGPRELGVILMAYGVGKSLANSNRIYTPDGYKLMSDIKVNDLVIGTNGEAHNVLGVYPQGLKDMYKVLFNDGTSTFCCKEHLWSVNSMSQRNIHTTINGKTVKLPKDNSFRVLSTEEISKKLRVDGGRHLNYRIPVIKPVNFKPKEVVIDPYVLGVLLGDGCITNGTQPNFVTKDQEIIREVEKRVNKSIKVTELKRNIEKEENGVLVMVERTLTKVSIHSIKNELIELELMGCNSGNKFIPSEYLYNSVENRIELLQGLMDTNGYCSKAGRIQFSTVSERLSNDVRELVLSLGGFCKIKNKIPTYKHNGIKIEGKKCYIITMSFSDESIRPFKLNRKLERVVYRKKYAFNKYIKTIEFSHKEEATCIMVDSDDSLFATDDFILTHNTTLATKIANTAKNLGKNVVQIFFEDNEKVIQRKHLACWSGYELNSLSLHKDELKEIVERKKKEKGLLILKKFPSGFTTVPIIKQYLRRLIAKGIRPDMIIIDYVDCLIPSKKVDDVNVGEGMIMREIETLIDEMQIAGWVCTQGNRSSIKSNIVEGDQMGGSIKKGQIGHFIISGAKSLDQKENGTANMAIIKSRFGSSGMIFEDIVFDNARVHIDMSSNKGPVSHSQFISNTDEAKQQRVNLLLEATKRLKEQQLENNN